ncbi:MAG: hypothetical protein IPK58_14450 [Acidobacteria bacterium]|nr:hypothetical protein [Acidobacteriota bacterium]
MNTFEFRAFSLQQPKPTMMLASLGRVLFPPTKMPNYLLAMLISAARTVLPQINLMG